VRRETRVKFKTRQIVHNSVFDVFTPTTQASLNFVPREAVNDQLVDALLTPGKQIVVYGETGSGKSTLLQKKLEELYESHITTRCSASSSFEKILLDAFDQLNQYYIDSTKSSASLAAKASLAHEIANLRTTIEACSASAFESTAKRAVAPQLTIQRLASGLGVEKMCWVIEDFHKVPEVEKTPLSQAFKIFSDMACDYAEVKIVAVGAAETARDVVAFDREMRHRLAEIHVPLMTENELREVVRNGEDLMNVKLDVPEAIISTFSTGLASVCHHLCLNICLAGDVYVTLTEPKHLGEAELQQAVIRYVEESSDTVKAAFDRALFQYRVRQYDNCRLILSALATGSLEGMLSSQVLDDIRKIHPDYPQSNLTTYLRELATEARGAVIRHSSDGRFRFSDPIYHAYARGVFWPGRSLVVASPELKPLYSIIRGSVTTNVARWAGAHLRRS